ncbi:MAG: argininosuccinate lyase [Melioribacteraceae bacterium]|nr:argininosuccinate lyase [Melioribacteraceae bacterium]
MLWGGRFDKEINSVFLKFSSSIKFDIILLKYDLAVSKAHANMLGACGIISKNETSEIIKGLELIEERFYEGLWNPIDKNYEDIHSAVESYLTELIGEAAKKLHTARSRNDQVATGFRMWIKDAALRLSNLLLELQKTFLDLAGQHTRTIIPGYTHLQRAQPVSFAFHLLAYVEMFERDKTRLQNVFSQADVCPLGSGALAGTTLKIDRNMTARELGFSSVSANAMDSISDRDFVIDFLNSCTIGMMHLSRLSEELILWSSSEWNFIKIDDTLTTGSSLMPQKKNPDAAELIRGKFGRIQGSYVAVSSMMKGLPLSYNRDMQEDKEPAFDSFKTYSESLALMKDIFENIIINNERFIFEIEGDYMLATDIADWLVDHNIPFREAHNIVGKISRYAVENNTKLNDLTINELKDFCEVFDDSVLEILDINSSLDRKISFGAPNPRIVNEHIKSLKKSIEIESVNFNTKKNI